MGIVYKAYDPAIDRQVAIKVISDRVLEIPSIKARFYREARTAGRLSHENITVVYDMGEYEGKTYIIMEYLEGRDLRHIIKSKENLTLQQKLDFAKQICRGLRYAHSKNVIHRDIKPENIKILDDERVKIIDFGIAKPDSSFIHQEEIATGTFVTEPGIRIGTVWYMSPEQFKGLPVDQRSDIFSFGIVFYELLTYKKPFDGDETTVMYKIVHEEPEKINIKDSDLVDELQKIVSRCLEKKPEARYGDCSELLSDLNKIIDYAAQENKIKKLLSKGNMLIKQKQYNSAMLKFNEILKFNPTHPEATSMIKKLLDREKESSIHKILTGYLDGEVISNFKIIERLGGGGMGVVYKAEDLTLKRIVALKFLIPELSRDEVAKRRFFKEAQATSALDHPNICTIHAINEMDNGLIFICMAYYEGEDLREKMSKGRLDVFESVDIAIKIAKGLCKAHNNGILHRDIKPANIIITSEGEVKIVDFGLAKLVNTATRITKTNTTIGTLPYMSPEQVKGLKLDKRTDIWSFGVLLYETLTDKLPFTGDYQAATLYSIVNESPVNPSTLNSDINQKLENVILKCIDKDLADRYSSMKEVLEELEKIQLEIKNERKWKEAHLAKFNKLIENGKIYLDKKQYKEALSRFRAALELETDNQAILQLIKECEEKQKNYEQIQQLFSNGNDAFNNKEYKKAVDYFEKLLVLEPDNTLVQELLLETHQKIEDVESIEKLLVEIDTLNKNKQFLKVIVLCKEILEKDATHSKARKRLAEAEHQIKQQTDISDLISKGKDSLKARSYQEALSFFTAAKKLDEDDQSISSLITEAETELEKVQHIENLLTQGKQQFANEEYQKAIDTFQQAIDLNPDTAEAKQLLVQSRAAFERSQRIATLLAEAESALGKQDFEKAIKLYEQVLEVDDQNSSGEGGLRRSKEALGHAKKISGLLRKGKRLLEAEKYQQAMSEFRQVLDLADGHSEAGELLDRCEAKLSEQKQIAELLRDGETFFDGGDYQKALTAFEKIVSLNPDDVQALEGIKKAQDRLEISETIQHLFTKAESLFSEKEYEQALNIYQQILELDAKNISAQTGLEKSKTAIDCHKKAARLISEGQTYFEKELFEEALTTFKAAKEFEPGNADVQNFIINVTSELRKLEKIQALLSTANKYYDKKNYHKALQTTQKILNLKPNYSPARELLANINEKIDESEKVQNLLSNAKKLLKAKNFEQALDVCDNVLKISPGNSQALSIRKKVLKGKTPNSPTNILAPVGIATALILSLIYFSGPIKNFINPDEQVLPVSLQTVKQQIESKQIDVDKTIYALKSQSKLSPDQKKIINDYNSVLKNVEQANAAISTNNFISAESLFSITSQDFDGIQQSAGKELSDLKTAAINFQQQAKISFGNSLSKESQISKNKKAYTIYQSAQQKTTNADSAFKAGNFTLSMNYYKQADSLLDRTERLVLDTKLLENGDNPNIPSTPEKEYTPQQQLEAENMRNLMEAAKNNVQGSSQYKNNNQKFQQAIALEKDGLNQVDSDNYTAATTSFSKAIELYKKANIEIVNNLKTAAINAKTAMNKVKKRIDNRYLKNPNYQEGLNLEARADKAFGSGDFDAASALYQNAGNFYQQTFNEIQKIDQQNKKIELAKLKSRDISNSLKSTLENRDLTGLVELLKLNLEEQDQWESFFDIAHDISVNILEKDFKVSGNAAETELSVQLSYQDNKNRIQMNSLVYKCLLKYRNNQWAFSEFKQL